MTTPAKPKLVDRWTALLETPFPDRIPRNISDEIDLEMLFDQVAGGVTTYLAIGKLSMEEVGSMRACYQALTDYLPHLRGDAAEYFGGLHDVAREILSHTDRARPFAD